MSVGDVDRLTSTIPYHLPSPLPLFSLLPTPPPFLVLCPFSFSFETLLFEHIFITLRTFFLMLLTLFLHFEQFFLRFIHLSYYYFLPVCTNGVEGA